MHLISRALLPAAGLLLTTSCSDYKVGALEGANDATPSIEVDPTQISFGGLAAGDQASEVFTISSVGSQALTVSDLRIQGSSAFTLTFENPSGTIAPGDSVDVVVTYTPTAANDEAFAVVESDDPAARETIVSLFGGGLYPVLTIDPMEVDFGLHDPGDVATETVRLINSGGATLDISQVAAIGEGFTSPTWAPASLEPGEETTVDVTFSPLIDGLYEGELWVSSNSTAGDTAATLRGTTVEMPIAVCEANPSEAFALYDTVTWKGRDSYDPSGYAITDYEWGLISSPEGSSVRMPNGTADRSPFLADIAGTYMAELVVTNEVGIQSEPCYAELFAVPSQDLWIEMYWDTANDDMDLHLLAPGGTLKATSDCYYANCVGRGLDWGVSGTSEDDPSLDIDDIPGTGPENINIFSPNGGIYTVYVHDYTGSTPDYSGANAVTVNVYLSGELAWTDTRDIVGENDYVPFASIDWEAQEVNGL